MRHLERDPLKRSRAMGGVCNNTKFQLFQTMFAKLPFHVIRLLYPIWTMYKLNFFVLCELQHVGYEWGLLFPGKIVFKQTYCAAVEMTK